MPEISFSIKKIFCAQIDIHMSTDSGIESTTKKGSITLSFGGATPKDPDKTSFMVSAILTVGTEGDNFYCRIDQRTIVEGTEKATPQVVEKWIMQEEEFLYQMLREKVKSLLNTEVEIMKILPDNLAKVEKKSQ